MTKQATNSPLSHYNCFCLVSWLIASVILPSGSQAGSVSHEPNILQNVQELQLHIGKLGQKTGTGIEMFYDTISDVAGSTNGRRYNQADKEWVETGLILYDLYRSLGGENLNHRIFFRRKDGLFLITESDGLGIWHKTPERALHYFLVALLDKSRNLSSSVLDPKFMEDKSASPTLSQKIKKLANATRHPQLSPGEELQIDLPNSDIAIVDKELILKNYSPNKSGISATVTSDHNSSPGPKPIFGFSSLQKFRPTQVELISITDTVNINNQNISVDIKRIKKTMSLEQGVADRIERRGEVKRFPLKLTSPSNLHFQSKGPTDLVGSLIDAKGNLISSDDDSGLGYNFSFKVRLKPGNYFLKIRHCCSGKGPFKLRMTRMPTH